VIVDIGRKIEGLVPASQFPQTNGLPAVSPGDTVEVMLIARATRSKVTSSSRMRKRIVSISGMSSKKQFAKALKFRAEF